MNAPQSFSASAPARRKHTPADLELIVRDRRFGRAATQDRWWMGGDPIGTAFYNALSVTFPKGEAFFVESVKAFREGTPERLQNEIRAFVKQEVNHSREHVAFNRRVVDAGYDVTNLEVKVDEALALTKGRPQIANLASTMALEHFTAIIAQQLLANPRHLDSADAESRQLWRWHAMEEIEHKGVAYDTWLHATRDWSRWQRWKVKSLVMLVVTKNFVENRAKGMLELLAQDGLSGPKIWAKLVWYALGRPGMLRKIILPWISYFMPGFHPWKHDDRYLIQLAESDYQDAVMDKTASTKPQAPALVPAE
ncbi:metal-dependent hydrolase [Blastomonas sp.]|uniref:metal-dependent hydrolase n=1 Tax=Blastomonas sp. TaxID=1909299 RepID=UPI003593E14D